MAFFTMPSLVAGPGAIQQLSGLGAQRAFVVVDPELLRRGGHRRVIEELQTGGASIELAPPVMIEPEWTSLEAGADRLRGFRPDWVVAVGGGSTIESAKGMWLRAALPQLGVEGIPLLSEPDLRAFGRFVAVPTTTGSGAESSWSVRFRQGVRTIEIAHRQLIPDWAILEPALAASQPREVLARCGAGALVRSIEAFLGPWANAFSDAAARGSSRALWKGLARLVRSTDDVELLGSIQSAVALSGAASANSQLGLAHAIADVLGPRAGRPLALLTALALPPVLEYLYPVCRERYPALGEWVDHSAGQQRPAFAGQVRDFFDRLGLPRHLVAAGVEPARLELDGPEVLGALLRSPATLASPRLPTPDEAAALLAAVAVGSPGPP